MEKLPTGVVSPKGKELEDFLNSRVKGQQRAVRYLREYMEIYWANLRNPNCPIGNFFFIGPSGVGKTEMAKALAEYMFGKPDRLTIIDCSEYAEGHEISGLTGAAPSFVGHGESVPKLTQWNIDRFDVEHLCETGELVDIYLDQLDNYSLQLLMMEINISQEIKDLKGKIAGSEKQIARMEQGLKIIKKRIEDRKQETSAVQQETVKEAEQETQIKDNLIATIAKTRADLAVFNEDLKVKEKYSRNIKDEKARARQEIAKWHKLKDEKATSDERLKAFYEAQRKGDYEHETGRFRSIILWDEIEKADKKLFNLLLSIMDRGKIELHDPPGQETVFSNTVNIFTSNLGSDKIAETLSELSANTSSMRVGFRQTNRKLTTQEFTNLDQQIYETTKQELRRFFSPEFANRINKVIVFRPLDSEALSQIVDLRIEDRLKRQPIKFEIDAEVKQFIVKEAMKNMSDGARLLDERIKQFVDSEIAPMINSGLLNNNDTVVVKLGKDNKLEFYKK